jgi:hypothetical protein
MLNVARLERSRAPGRRPAAAAQEVAATAAAEATIASDLASRGWAQERMR